MKILMKHSNSSLVQHFQIISIISSRLFSDIGHMKFAIFGAVSTTTVSSFRHERHLHKWILMLVPALFRFHYCRTLVWSWLGEKVISLAINQLRNVDCSSQLALVVIIDTFHSLHLSLTMRNASDSDFGFVESVHTIIVWWGRWCESLKCIGEKNSWSCWK